MSMLKRYLVWLVLVAVLITSCGSPEPFCPRPTGTPQHLTVRPELLPTSWPPTPVEMEIGGQAIVVDRVVTGPLCNGHWSGTVYVTCDVQVYPWEGRPTFLKECDLTIEPGTVVYVADHGDEPFYKGCSCHTGSVEP
jgi:hypothetical protein